jgi:hypothetical protein
VHKPECRRSRLVAKRRRYSAEGSRLLAQFFDVFSGVGHRFGYDFRRERLSFQELLDRVDDDIAGRIATLADVDVDFT